MIYAKMIRSISLVNFKVKKCENADENELLLFLALDYLWGWNHILIDQLYKRDIGSTGRARTKQ